MTLMVPYMRTIFILDNDENILEVLKLILSTHNYEVTTFCNSKELLRAVSHVLPDILLLDVKLSEDVDGKSVCSILKQEYKYPNKIFLYSATPVSVEEMKKCGADGFLEKPFDMDVFLDAIDNAHNF